MDRQQEKDKLMTEIRKEYGIELIAERLSALLKNFHEYKKTGLTPDQIMRMDEMYAEKCRQLADKTAVLPEDAKATIAHLENLHQRCKNMMGTDLNNEIWEADCRAMEIAIKAVRQQYMENGAEKKGTEKQGAGIRLYLSGPISGTDDYMERFREAENRLTEEGYSVLNPARMLESLPGGFAYEEYMTICMGLLTACDAVCMLNGWEGSPGANREYGFALARGMGIYK